MVNVKRQVPLVAGAMETTIACRDDAKAIFDLYRSGTCQDRLMQGQSCNEASDCISNVMSFCRLSANM